MVEVNHLGAEPPFGGEILNTNDADGTSTVFLKTTCAIKCIMLPIHCWARTRRGEIIGLNDTTYNIRFAEDYTEEYEVSPDRLARPLRKPAKVGAIVDCWVDEVVRDFTDWPAVSGPVRPQGATTTAQMRGGVYGEHRGHEIEVLHFLQAQQSSSTRIGGFGYPQIRRGHPNIIPPLFVASVPQVVFMGLPRLNTTTCDDVIHDQLSKEEVRVRDCVAQVADGLAFAHRHGVAHINLFPENICITEHDGRRTYVIDGWAQSVRHADCRPANSDDGLTWGKYLARGCRPVTEATEGGATTGDFAPVPRDLLRDRSGMRCHCYAYFTCPELFFASATPHFGFNVDTWQLGILMILLATRDFPHNRSPAQVTNWLELVRLGPVAFPNSEALRLRLAQYGWWDPMREPWKKRMGDVVRRQQRLTRLGTLGELALIQRLLAGDPQQRPSMAAVLRDQWITGHEEVAAPAASAAPGAAQGEPPH